MPQGVEATYLTGAKAEVIVDPVISRCPVDLEVGSAELSQLVHVQLDSDTQVVGERIGEADSAVGPLRAAGVRLHGQIIVLRASVVKALSTTIAATVQFAKFAKS